MSKRKPTYTMTVKTHPPRDARAGTEDTLMSSGFSDDSRRSGQSVKDDKNPKGKNSKKSQPTQPPAKRLSVLHSGSESVSENSDGILNESPNKNNNKKSSKKLSRNQNRPREVSLRSSSSEGEDEADVDEGPTVKVKATKKKGQSSGTATATKSSGNNQKKRISQSDSEEEDEEEEEAKLPAKSSKTTRRLSFDSSNESKDKESGSKSSKIKPPVASTSKGSSKQSQLPPTRGSSQTRNSISSDRGSTGLKINLESPTIAQQKRLERYSYVEVSPSASLFNFNFKKPKPKDKDSQSRRASFDENNSVDTEVMEASPPEERQTVDRMPKSKPNPKSKQNPPAKALTPPQSPVKEMNTNKKSVSPKAAAAAKEQRNPEPLPPPPRKRGRPKKSSTATIAPKSSTSSRASANQANKKPPEASGSSSDLSSAALEDAVPVPVPKEPVKVNSSTRTPPEKMDELFSNLSKNVNKRMSAMGMTMAKSTSKVANVNGGGGKDSDPDSRSTSSKVTSANTSQLKLNYDRTKRMTSVLDRHTPDDSYDGRKSKKVDTRNTRLKDKAPIPQLLMTSSSESDSDAETGPLVGQKSQPKPKKPSKDQEGSSRPRSTKSDEEKEEEDGTAAAVGGKKAGAAAGRPGKKSGRKVSVSVSSPPKSRTKPLKAYKVADVVPKLKEPRHKSITPDLQEALSSSGVEDEAFVDGDETTPGAPPLVVASSAAGAGAGDVAGGPGPSTAGSALPGTGDSAEDGSPNRIRIHPEPSSLSRNFSRTVDVEGVSLACLVDTDMVRYKALTNAHQATQVAVSIAAPCVSYIYPQHLSWTQIHPGVYMCITFNSGDVKTGYMRLDPRTVKPLEKSGSAFVCMSVMDGKIAAKSTSFNFNEVGEPYLTSVELFEGSHLTVPGGTMYSIENWEDEEASLHFTIVRQSEGPAGSLGNGEE